MAKGTYKAVDFDQAAANQVGFQDLEPVVVAPNPLDQFGFSERQLYNKNIRELAKAVSGVQTVFVSSTNGGATDLELTFTDGVLTAVT